MLTDVQKELRELVEKMNLAQARVMLDFAQTLMGTEPLTAEFLLKVPGYSDSWSDEDLKDFQRAGLDHMDQECPWDDGDALKTHDVRTS